MQVQDCPWEIENIGKRTVQLNYAKDDIYNSEEVCNAVKGYQYLVAKVPAGNISCLLGLQDDGFKMIETQLALSKKYKDFNFNDPLITFFTHDLKYDVVKEKTHLNNVLSRMTPHMFSTDRICLDQQFGPEIGLHRYQTWIKNEFKKGSILTEWYINDVAIGFGLYRIEGNVLDGLLGGIYEEYQNEGWGMLTAAGNVLFPTMMGYSEVKKCKTAVSSNNMPVISFYNYLNYKIDEMEYVLVKHIE